MVLVDGYGFERTMVLPRGGRDHLVEYLVYSVMFHAIQKEEIGGAVLLPCSFARKVTEFRATFACSS